MQIAELYKEVFAPCWFWWRYTFRALLWHGGHCSEPINYEVIVLRGRPGAEVKQHGRKGLEALILLGFFKLYS